MLNSDPVLWLLYRRSLSNSLSILHVTYFNLLPSLSSPPPCFNAKRHPPVLSFASSHWAPIFSIFIHLRCTSFTQFIFKLILSYRLVYALYAPFAPTFFYVLFFFPTLQVLLQLRNKQSSQIRQRDREQFYVIKFQKQLKTKRKIVAVRVFVFRLFACFSTNHLVFFYRLWLWQWFVFVYLLCIFAHSLVCAVLQLCTPMLTLTTWRLPCQSSAIELCTFSDKIATDW